MAQFESKREELEKAGLGVVYVAGQSRRGLLGAERYVRKHPISVPYLCDERRQVLRAYGVYRALGLDGLRVAYPTVFLLDPEGAVRFLYVGDHQRDRLSPERLLEEFHRRFGSGSSSQ